MSHHKIICGDCVEVMGEMKDGGVDLVVTSPPYDNLRDYKGYSFDFGCVAKGLYRILKKGGVVVWVVGDATINGSETGTSFRQALSFKEIGFNLHDTMIWFKNSMTMPSKNRYYSSFEYMFIFSKGKPKTANLIKDKVNKNYGGKGGYSVREKDGGLKKKKPAKIGKYGIRFNVWQQPSEKTEIRAKHPAIFPEQLAHDHIYSWSNEGDTVLDTFVGSGTTLVACERVKRNSIGIEISKEYCEQAYKRLKNKVEQTKRYGKQSTIERIGF